jgi:hypothetical protein
VDYIYDGFINSFKNQKMKKSFTKTSLLYCLTLTFCFTLASCQKEEPINDLTLEIAGTYQGEYREGEEDFTVIVSNVTGTATKTTDDTFDMELALVPGLFSLEFTAQMLTTTTFSVQEFELDGDLLEGQGVLEGTILNVAFFEAGTSKAYGSYIAQKK